ncbi:MAG: GAF domain-containing protein [Chthonomonas sp.]|nr:GAF domain-containing protein [Chthonomonas sp.]
MGAIREIKVNDIYDLLDVAYAEGNVNLDAYLVRVLKKSEEWFGASGISVFLREGETDRYLLAAAAGLLSTVPKDATIVRGMGIAGLAIQDARTRLLVDPRQESDLNQQNIQRRDTIGSSLIVPLITRNQGCIGVLNVARAADAPTFTENDLEAAESLGRQIALAVNNARAIVDANSRRLSLQNAIESVGFGLMMIHADGSFADYTAEVGSILGAEPSDYPNWTEYFSRIQANFQVPFRHAMERAKKGLSYRFRVAVDEQTRAFAVVVSPLQGGGVIIALNDITEHEKARETVERIHRLAEIGQLTASIAHEIRNPLAGIQSAATMILEDPQLATEFARMIEGEATKLNLLCSEFLDFAKPISLEFEPMQLGDIARQVCQRHVEQFEAAQVSVKLQISPDEPVLYADPLRIEQVVRNLILNALQASEPGSTVTLQVTAHGVLRVVDEGQGMDKETQDRLFTPFFTTKPNGTGLGLSVARKIVEAHKARLSVETTEGKGSTFALDFNVSEAA